MKYKFILFLPGYLKAQLRNAWLIRVFMETPVFTPLSFRGLNVGITDIRLLIRGLSSRTEKLVRIIPGVKAFEG